MAKRTNKSSDDRVSDYLGRKSKALARMDNCVLPIFRKLLQDLNEHMQSIAYANTSPLGRIYEAFDTLNGDHSWLGSKAELRMTKKLLQEYLRWMEASSCSVFVLSDFDQLTPEAVAFDFRIPLLDTKIRAALGCSDASISLGSFTIHAEEAYPFRVGGKVLKKNIRRELSVAWPQAERLDTTDLEQLPAIVADHLETALVMAKLQ